MKLEDKKFIIFDLDGTIVKLDVDWVNCRKEVKNIIIKNHPQLKFIFTEKEIELKKQSKKITVEMMGILAYNSLGYDIYNEFKNIQEKYEFNCKLKINKNHQQIINFIKSNKNNYKFIICSNNSLSGITYVLNKLKIKDFFFMIKSREIGRPPKPFFVIMDDIFSLSKVKKGDYLYVGDNIFTDKMLADNFKIDYIDYKDFANIIKL